MAHATWIMSSTSTAGTGVARPAVASAERTANLNMMATGVMLRYRGRAWQAMTNERTVRAAARGAVRCGRRPYTCTQPLHASAAIGHLLGWPTVLATRVEYYGCRATTAVDLLRSTNSHAHMYRHPPFISRPAAAPQAGTTSHAPHSPATQAKEADTHTQQSDSCMMSSP